MKERMVETATTKARKAYQQQAREQPDVYYAFRLNEAQVVALRSHGLPDSAALALGAIAAAAYGTRKTEWVILPPRTMDAFRRGYRWWLRATKALEAAGLIECERHVGRMPRYRLVPQPKGRKGSARLSVLEAE